MLSTLAAIILSYQVSVSTYVVNFKHSMGFVNNTSEIPYLQNPVLKAVVDHYNHKGQWAGIFKIDHIIKFRIEKINAEKSIAHVKYFYAPVPNNAQGRTDSGIDQRTFTFIENADGIKVIKMGAYNSTKL